MKRTQIYLADAQDRALAERAKSTGRTKSQLIRDAVDAYLAGPDDEQAALSRFHSALGDAFGIASYLPDGATYVEGVRGTERARQAELDRRWRG